MNSDRGPKSDAPELIDLIGGRLEVVARMGTSDSDTVLFRGQLAPGKSVPLHSTSTMNAFMSSADASKFSSPTTCRVGARLKQAIVCSSPTASSIPFAT